MKRAMVLSGMLFLYVLPALGAAPAPWKPVVPKIALIGDSIKGGYAPLVAKRLEGKATIVSVPNSGGDSANLLAHLDEWLAREKPAIVHFNCGLHDLKQPKTVESPAETGTTRHQVELADYESNLRKIVARLKQESDIAVVFATTTPILDQRHAGRKATFDRCEADVQRYNAAAIAVMHEAGVPVHDLHALVEQEGPATMLGPDGTHYTPQGYERLAEAVADCVLRHWIVLQFSGPSKPRPSGPEAAARYRQVEADRDATVPAAYKNLPIGKFQVPADAQAWQKQREETLRVVRQSLGDLPPRPAKPSARVVSRELRRGYALQRLSIDNGDRNDISALLLIPERRQTPAPAILWLHSSTPDKNGLITPGGSEETMGELLVRAGFVVLAPDAYYYGDRAENVPGGAVETYRRGSPDAANFVQDRLLKLNLWLGRTLWGMFVRDDQIALDYLCTVPEVDAKRIGATGMSMGSTRAWWLAAIDQRVAATVGVACLTRYENLINHGNLRAHGLYYFSYGLLKHFDTEGVLALIAPRPFLALTGDLDYGSPVDGIRVLEEKVSGVYRAVDAPEQFKSIVYPEVGHSYTPEMCVEMLNWFKHHLKPEPQ